MRVPTIGPGKGVSDIGRKKKAAADGRDSAFSKELHGLGDTGGASPVVDVGATASVESILALQEVGDATEDRDRAAARRYGEEILDRLETIRADLLGGTISKDRLAELAQNIRAQRAKAKDPRLQRILDEIDLRARVEIAKFTRDV